MTGKHLSLGCLLLLTAVGPCYYYYSEDYSRAKKTISNERVTLYCQLPVPDHLTLEKSGSWVWKQPDLHFKWYINSVYVDRRLDIPFIRIIAMAKELKTQSLFCQIWSNSKMIAVLKAKQQELWIHAWDLAKPGQYYHPYLLSCPISSQMEDAIAISISIDNPCAAPTHWMSIPPIYEGSQKRFVVCLKPLHFKSDISSRLIEWLELQFLLGADAVLVYVKQIHSKTWKVLQYYEKSGRLTLINHTMPGIEEATGLWQKRRHEITVYNDCLYRHLETHHFVVNLDLDEAIIPVIQDSWSGLLVNHSDSASLSVRCAYFFDNLGEETSIPQHLHMLRHIYRSSHFAPPGFAQKSFFATKNAEAVSNHFALRAVNSTVRLLSGLDVEEARLHHYRTECPPKMEDECDLNHMRFRQRDTLIWKYRDKLERKVRQTMQELKG